MVIFYDDNNLFIASVMPSLIPMPIDNTCSIYINFI